jgi:hypothetical protein
MADPVFSPGDLVYLTGGYEAYVKDKNPKLTVPLVNRLAKIEEIIDWDSDVGKAIKEERVKSDKWADLPIEECKYMLSVYYPDLIGRNGEQGVVERTPSFCKHPKNGTPFFMKIPNGIFKEIANMCEKLGYGAL